MADTLTLTALPTPRLSSARLARLAADYAALTKRPPSDRREELLSAIVMLVPPEQRRALHRLIRQVDQG